MTGVLFVFDDCNGVAQSLEFDFFLDCVFDFFLTSRQFFHATTIDDIDMLSTQTLCPTAGVHCHVTAANDSDSVALSDRSIVFGIVSLHQVQTGQVFVSGVNASQTFAGDLHEHGQASAGAHEYCVKAVFIEQFVDGDGLADQDVGHDVNAQLLQLFDFASHDCLGQTEFGDTINQNATSDMECLENGDFITQLCQVSSTGQAGGARTGDSDLLAVGSGLFDLVFHVFTMPVGNETFQTADAHGLGLDAADALALALVLLGTDTTGDSGQSVGAGDDLISFLKFTSNDLLDEVGDLNVNGAAGHTGHVLAVQAASCFVLCHFYSVTGSDFQEVLITNQGILRGHRVLFRTHIRHNNTISFLPYLIRSLPSFSKRQAWSFFSSSSVLKVARRLISSSKSTSAPLKSGPSTQANFISPPTVTRQQPHIPVPSTIRGHRETMVSTPKGFAVS